jgi:mRNA interferase MazF
MTTQTKGYPFEVQITGKSPGVALADQVKSMDWKERQARFKGQATPQELDEARAKACVLIGRKM